MRPRFLTRRGHLGAVVLAAALGALLLAPAGAHAQLPDLVPDIPGPADIAESVFKFFFKTFFGIEARVTRRVVEFLVAQPVYTNGARYPELAQLRSYITAGSWGVFTLVFTASGLRYWAAGFTQSSSYEALEALGRSIVAAGGLAIFPKLFEYLVVTGNLVTKALVDAPGVQAGITKLLAAALVLNFATLGVGSIASIVAVICLLLLVLTKIVLSTVLAILFVSGGLAIALWPLPETSWLARTWFQSLFAVVLWPIVWTLCFAVFAVVGNSAFNLSGSFGDTLIKPWVAVAALFAAYKAPQLLARQAMMAGVVPSLGRGMSQAAVYGRGARGLAGGGSGGAAGYSGRHVGATGAAKAASGAG